MYHSNLPTRPISQYKLFVLGRQLISSDAPDIKNNAGAIVGRDGKWFVNAIIVLL